MEVLMAGSEEQSSYTTTTRATSLPSIGSFDAKQLLNTRAVWAVDGGSGLAGSGDTLLHLPGSSALKNSGAATMSNQGNNGASPGNTPSPPTFTYRGEAPRAARMGHFPHFAGSSSSSAHGVSFVAAAASQNSVGVVGTMGGGGVGPTAPGRRFESLFAPIPSTSDGVGGVGGGATATTPGCARGGGGHHRASSTQQWLPSLPRSPRPTVKRFLSFSHVLTVTPQPKRPKSGDGASPTSCGGGGGVLQGGGATTVAPVLATGAHQGGVSSTGTQPRWTASYHEDAHALKLGFKHGFKIGYEPSTPRFAAQTNFLPAAPTAASAAVVGGL